MKWVRGDEICGEYAGKMLDSLIFNRGFMMVRHFEMSRNSRLGTTMKI